MDKELLAFLQGMESRLRTELGEQIEKAVKDLLADNLRWARIHENRERCFNLRVNEFDQRFALLEERIRELENYYLHPPKS